MNKLYIMVIALVTFFGTIQGAETIHQLDDKYAILAEGTEWTCTRNTTTNPFRGSGYPLVEGKGVNLPVSFECSALPYGEEKPNVQQATNLIHDLLSQYARAKNAIFSCVHLKENGECDNVGRSDYFIFDGVYCDDVNKGSFAIYLSKKKHIMLIKFRGNVLDRHCQGTICQKAISLITPIVS